MADDKWSNVTDWVSAVMTTTDDEPTDDWNTPLASVYEAEMLCVPIVSEARLLLVAVLLEIATGEPNVAPSTMNWTVPVGIGADPSVPEIVTLKLAA
jgi:hypothetical protein